MSSISGVEYTGEEDLFSQAVERFRTQHGVVLLKDSPHQKGTIVTVLSKHYFVCELCRVRREGGDLLSYDLKRHVQTPDHWKKLQECGKTTVLFTVTENEEFAVSTALPVGIFTSLDRELQRVLCTPKFWCKLCPSEAPLPMERNEAFGSHRSDTTHAERRLTYDARRQAYLAKHPPMDKAKSKYRGKGSYRSMSNSPVSSSAIIQPSTPTRVIQELSSSSSPNTPVYYSGTIITSPHSSVQRYSPQRPVTPRSSISVPGVSTAAHWAQFKQNHRSVGSITSSLKVPDNADNRPRSASFEEPFLTSITLPPNGCSQTTLQMQGTTGSKQQVGQKRRLNEPDDVEVLGVVPPKISTTTSNAVITVVDLTSAMPSNPTE